MSKMAALSAMAGRAGGAMGSRVGAAGTAFQGTAAYQGAAATAGEEVGLTINYGQIGLIIMFVVHSHHCSYDSMHPFTG
jgi:hypothetical protein